MEMTDGEQTKQKKHEKVLQVMVQQRPLKVRGGFATDQVKAWTQHIVLRI